MNFVIVTLLLTLAPSSFADPAGPAGRTYRCGLRGFWVRLAFRDDGRHFHFENSLGESGDQEVAWGNDGEGRTADPDDPTFSFDARTGQFALRGQTCVIDAVP